MMASVFAKMNWYLMDKIQVCGIISNWLTYDEVESCRDLFMQSTPEVIGFVQSQTGLNLERCQILLDDWVDIVACAQSIKDKQ